MSTNLAAFALLSIVFSTNVSATEDHCRIVPNTSNPNAPFRWRIKPGEPKEFASKDWSDFQIVRGPVRDSARLGIYGGDRFKVWLTPDERLLLQHFRVERGRLVLLATSILIGDSSNLWARGNVRLMPEGPEIGEYVVFRLVDRKDETGKECRHRNAQQTVPSKVCRSFRVEYFENGDGGSYGHKPSIKPGNIEPINEHNLCVENHPTGGSGTGIDADKQTGEGDGDEGPD